MSIVSLLIALLLPALSKARETAQRISCASNLRQLYICGVIYSDDHKGWGISYVYESQPHVWRNAPGWRGYFQNHERTTVCPGASAVAHRGATPGKVYEGNPNPTVYTTYFNLFAVGSRTTPAYYAVGDWASTVSANRNSRVVTNPSPNREWLGSYRESAMPHATHGRQYAWYGQPHEQVAFTDAFDGDDGFWTSSWLGTGSGAKQIPNNHAASDGENIAWMDGHVIWRAAAETTRKYPYGSVYW